MATTDEVSAVRARILATAPDPARDAVDLMRDAARAASLATGHDPGPDAPEVRVRLHGPGVVGHGVPVAAASGLLDALQGAVTAVGAARRRRRDRSAAATRGPRPSVAAATELRLHADVLPGSVVFFLAGPAEPTTGGELAGTTSTETLLDQTVRELFGVLDAAGSDNPAAAGELRESLRGLGADATGRLDRLARRSLDSDVEVDLAWRNAAGGRARAALRRRGARALRDAAEAARVQESEADFVGVLRTVSDGADPLRLARADNGQEIRLKVQQDAGAGLGGMLTHRVRVRAAVTTTWNLKKGTETSTYSLISVEDLGPAE